ncbi:substrate-binding domain-containing protein [Streptomyces sp. NPDC007861]|uniref:substrate-binding domain-containing protein n=1 Tax=Streptomyces sp. NPDC007861 TaxID=3154893 RepID=UPI003410073B
MEWVSAENIVAVGTAMLGVLASAGVLWYERRVPSRKRIGYRIQLDTPIGSNGRRNGRPNIRLGLFSDTPDMSDGTLVLLRIENDGSQSIADNDYTGREVHGLTVDFTDRFVRGLAVTHGGGAEHLAEHFTPSAGLRYVGNTLYIPRVPLNRGEYYKLLVLLSGGPVGCEVRITGGIRDGEVMPNRAVLPDDKTPLFSNAARNITVLLTACVVALAAIIVVRDDSRPPIGCATGELTVNGSTAFAPVVRELAKKYEKDCAGSKITVDAHGSTAGIRSLAAAGEQADEARKGSPPVIALSDGPKPGGFPQLRENRIAVSAFTLVANDKVPVTNLALDDIRAIYRGDITDWSELGGPQLKILLVSRDANSGTREIFQRRVLNRNEPAHSSRDCVHKDDPESKVTRCELDSTEQVLSTVAKLPGAIGYSELRAGTTLKGVHRLTIDGDPPSVETVGTSAYPYREIEYAYTYGRPPADSLASSFLTYMRLGSGQDVITTHGHLPCVTPKGLRVCGEE